MQLPTHRIATRLMIAFALPTAAVVAVTALFMVASARRAFEDQYAHRLELLATTLAAQIDPDAVLSLMPGDEQQGWYLDIAGELQRQQQAADLRGLVLFGNRGQVFVDATRRYQIDQVLEHWQADAEVIARARRGAGEAWVEDTAVEPAVYRAYKRLEVPRPAGAAADDEELLLLGVESELHYREAIRAYVRALAPIAALALLAVVLIALVVARTITRPVRELVAEARRIGGGDLEGAVQVEGHDELAFLGRTLDEMRLGLHARDRERQAMLAGIAHEVRNPLGGMELFLGLLREGLEELGPETADEDRQELREYSGRVQRELGYLKGVVNDFLAFAREAPVDRSSVELRELLDEVASVVEGEASSREIALHIDEQAGGALDLDRGAIHRALLNLTQNALQATPAGGQVTLTSHRNGSRVELAVEDNGKGIPAEKLAEVTTPFFTTREKGTGLGLAIVDKIARAHGGELAIDSEPGRGTRVRLILPTVTAPAEEEMGT